MKAKENRWINSNSLSYFYSCLVRFVFIFSFWNIISNFLLEMYRNASYIWSALSFYKIPAEKLSTLLWEMFLLLTLLLQAWTLKENKETSNYHLILLSSPISRTIAVDCRRIVIWFRIIVWKAFYCFIDTGWSVGTDNFL